MASMRPNLCAVRGLCSSVSACVCACVRLCVRVCVCVRARMRVLSLPFRHGGLRTVEARHIAPRADSRPR
eukprot:6188413-Pleurochrysis_carterae.AAC.1